MERPIRTSAKALIIKNGKVLVIKLNDKGDIFYILPGGGQESEEILTDTVKREVAEEIGITVLPKELVFVIEGVHGESFHRIDLVFLCEYINDIKHAKIHTDINQVGYEWLDIESLMDQPLYPSKLRRQIKNLYNGEKYKNYLGNEEIGDPDYLE